MLIPKKSPHRQARAGFTLPAILVVVAALLILAVGVLLVVSIERNTARSFSDRQRAELAARAGLEDVRAIFTLDAANDDFVVIQSSLVDSITTGFQAAPDLFLARGKVDAADSSKYSYRYIPLFSTLSYPSSNALLAAPVVEPLLANSATSTPADQYKEFTTLPYNDKVRASWLPVRDEQDRMIARYAYWVEDLQSRVDAGSAGNTKDTNGAHMRYGWKAGDTSNYAKFPAPGLNAIPSNPGSDGRDKEPPLDQVALYALDPAVTGATDSSALDKKIIDGRKALVSPESALSVSGIVPPLTRAYGHFTDPKARAVEENLTASVQPYDEQPLVPFATGIDTSVAGKPKLNLNALIAKAPATAVDEMAAWITKGLPRFDTRKGGFPENYAKTLAANAIGYAATGNKPIVQMGSYRGLGKSPMISEIVLDVNYLGQGVKNGNKVMYYQFVLFAEMFNHTNLPIDGGASLSYEVAFPIPNIGAGPTGTRFDDLSLVGDPAQCNHDLVLQNGRYWSQKQNVKLAAGEYKFFKFSKVNYTINVGTGSVGGNFSLTEPVEGAAGLSMKWNDEDVERIPSIVRAPEGLTFNASYIKFYGKAAIPGHSYGPYGDFINNMGDPRIAHFIRYAGKGASSANGVPLGENSFPENISPNRRNIRYSTIYSSDSSVGKLKTYGRVIPSEWPDGGHDAQVDLWSSGWGDDRQGYEGSKTKLPYSGKGPFFDPTNASVIAGAVLPKEGEAITYLSDRGRYYSATELGRLFDPIMFLPTFDPASGLNSTSLRGVGEPIKDAGILPAAGVPWPLVQVGNSPSLYFGGGNTLRIGRPEHPKFNQDANGSVDHAPNAMPGTHAARLLDLFHTGKPRSSDASLREGAVSRIEGNMNINTASRDALRTMAAGLLVMDPKLSKRTSDTFDGRMAPAISALTLSAPTVTKQADIIADAIIRGRPYSTPSELACAVGSDGKQVFGNPDLYAEKNTIQWSDSAAEEVFGRVYEASTVRSRNFRVWVVAQSVLPTSSSNTTPEILSEVRKVYTIFADPSQRTNNGNIDPTKYRVTISNENDF